MFYCFPGSSLSLAISRDFIVLIFYDTVLASIPHSFFTLFPLYFPMFIIASIPPVLTASQFFNLRFSLSNSVTHTQGALWAGVNNYIN